MKREKEKNMTPEEQFDRTVLDALMYPLFIRVIMVLFVGIEAFGCLMPMELNLSLLFLFCSILIFWILHPLLYETRGNRMVRRIRMCSYFPVRRREFLMSKIKLVANYMGIFWPAVGVIEVLVIAFFDMERFLASMIAIPVFSIVITALLLFFGTVGAKKTEM
ncbi:MAG: hypothetical protein ACI4FZ_13125 [Lachnospiraceae bacterium]